MILFKESSLNPLAQNKTSTAFGVWQGLYPIRVKYAAKVGVDPNTKDVDEQLLMFKAYVSERYGTAEAALAFHEANGYY